MRLPVEVFHCEQCGKEFDAPRLSDFNYGEFLLWSDGGNLAYVNAIESGVFAEVCVLFERTAASFEFDTLRLSQAIQHFFGTVASDPDSDGSLFRMGGFPPCPHCGSSQPSSWDEAQPGRLIDIEPHESTHRHWASLAPEEKESLAELFLTSLGKPTA